MKVIATRHVNDRSWNNNLPEIARLRRQFEAGTHNMATGRSGDQLLLYSIKQRAVTPRPDYFKLRVEGLLAA